MSGLKAVKSGQIILEALDISLAQLPPIEACFLGAVYNLIVYVGVVANVIYFQTLSFKPPYQNIKGHCSPGVAHVSVVVDRGATDIKTDLARVNGL
jgi:hypothetical protein